MVTGTLKSGRIFQYLESSEPCRAGKPRQYRYLRFQRGSDPGSGFADLDDDHSSGNPVWARVALNNRVGVIHVACGNDKAER
jgi:hypothetical protein